MNVHHIIMTVFNSRLNSSLLVVINIEDYKYDLQALTFIGDSFQTGEQYLVPNTHYTNALFFINSLPISH